MIFGHENDHCWKSSFLVPDQRSGVQNDQLGRAEKMGGKKIETFFLGYKKGHFFTFWKIFKTGDFDQQISL